MTDFKVGDKIIYLGTKEGRDDVGSGWNVYFRDHGIKKGSRGVISDILGEGIFIKEDGRPYSTGRLLKCDIALAEYPCEFKEFKVGDRVRATKNCPPAIKGEIYKLEKGGVGSSVGILEDSRPGLVCYCSDTWELVEYGEDFNDTKVRILNKEECIKVQEAMFKRGFSWNGDKTIKYDESTHLYFGKDNDLGFTSSNSETFFNDYEYREITIHQILKGGNEKAMEKRTL